MFTFLCFLQFIAKSALNLLNITAYPLPYSDITSIKNTNFPHGNGFGII